MTAAGVTGETTGTSSGRPVTPVTFRDALGHFCTGVTVITTTTPEGPVGFACQAFAAVSLDPPLVLFCPTKGSGTWRFAAGTSSRTSIPPCASGTGQPCPASRPGQISG